MESMQKFTFLLLFFLTNLSLYSQAGGVAPLNPLEPVSIRELEQNSELLNRYLRGLYTPDNSTIEGSPFLNDEFSDGGIIFKENILTAQIRYNVAQEQMEILLRGKKYALQDGFEVFIGGKKYKKLEYYRDGKKFLGYFEIITDPESKTAVLLKKSLKRVRPGQAVGAMRPATSPKYVDHSDFYLQLMNSRPIEVEGRRKKFLKAFPKEHRGMVKSYMKENKYSSRNEQDLIKIVSFYNSLL